MAVASAIGVVAIGAWQPRVPLDERVCSWGLSPCDGLAAWPACSVGFDSRNLLQAFSNLFLNPALQYKNSSLVFIAHNHICYFFCTSISKPFGKGIVFHPVAAQLDACRADVEGCLKSRSRNANPDSLRQITSNGSYEPHSSSASFYPY